MRPYSYIIILKYIKTIKIYMEKHNIPSSAELKNKIFENREQFLDYVDSL